MNKWPAYLDGRLWVPRTVFADLEQTKRDLVFKPKKRGEEEPEPIVLFEDRPEEGWIGVPPAWGMRHLSGVLDVVDRTTQGEPFESEATRPDPNHPSVNDPAAQAKFMADMEAAVTGSPWPLSFRAKAPTGTGKCLAPGTKVLSFDGSVTRVEDLVPGDVLMGPDNEPRKVLSTSSGHGPMYEIRPTRGDAWRCNDEHVLTLKHTQTGEVLDISVNEYVRRSKNFKHLYKSFSVNRETVFKHGVPDPEIPPYFLGLWIGDGSKNLLGVAVTKADEEVLKECESVARSYELRVRTCAHGGRCPTHHLVGRRGGVNKLLSDLRVLMGRRVIPQCVRSASLSYRRELLAGIMDSDGHVSGSGVEIVQKNEDYAQGIAFVARSLGIKVTTSDKVVNGATYKRLFMSGNFEDVPTRIARKTPPRRRQRKDPTRTGFDVVSVGHGPYHGFTLSGDGRFLLSDFTVTHNTVVGAWIAAGVVKRKTLVLSHLTRINEQWGETFSCIIGLDGSRIGYVQSGEKNWYGKDVVIATLQTIALSPGSMPPEFYQSFGCVIVDEVHRCGAPAFSQALWQFPAAVKFGLSATHDRKDGAQVVVDSYLDDVKVESTAEALPIQVWPVWYQSRGPVWGKTHGARVMCVTRDRRRNERIVGLIKRMYDQGRQGIVVGEIVAHLEQLMGMCEEAGIPRTDMGQFTAKVNAVVEKPVPGTDRTQTTKVVRAQKSKELDRIKRESRLIFATYGMIKEGIDIPRLDAGIDVTPRADATQLIGRVRRPHEGKKSPILWVTIVDQRSPVFTKYYQSRLKEYVESGAEVISR